MSDKRTYERFNVFVVGEFSSPQPLHETFFGITRDFSCSGMSFESKNFDIAPGDRLDVTFKHPREGTNIRSSAQVVWQRKDRNYGSIAGIRFTKEENSEDSSVLKLMSESGNIPLQSFLSRAYSGIMAQYKTATEQTVTLVQDCNSGNESDIAREGSDRLSEDRDRTIDEETGSVCVVPVRNEENVTGPRRGWMYLLVLLAASILFVVALPIRFDNFVFILSNPLPRDSVTDATNSLPSDFSDQEGSTDNGPGEPLEGSVPGPAPSPEITGSVAGPEDNALSHAEYYIQVGSWKNPDYAREALDRLVSRYPDAFIAQEGGFSKVRVPDISDRSEGDRVMQDLEHILGITPLIVKRTAE